MEKTYEQGGVSYLLDKSRLSIRLQPPMSEERRRKAVSYTHLDVYKRQFKEFSAKKLTQEQKPSIRKLIVSLKEKAAALNAQREKVKNKDRGIAR